MSSRPGAPSCWTGRGSLPPPGGSPRSCPGGCAYLDEAERAAHLVVLDRGRVLVQGSYDQVRAGFAGALTQADQPVRAEWCWRRGRVLHEYWPLGDPSAGTTIAPDLEDIVIALSLARRNAVPS